MSSDRLVLRDELNTSLYANKHTIGILYISTTDDIYVPAIGLNKESAIQLRDFLNEFIGENND